jgi:hypothetical protein
VYNKNNKFKKSHKPINSKILNALFLFIVFGFQHTTFAGNFFTENPGTTDVEHVEYTPAISFIKKKKWSAFYSPQVEVNLGILTDFQGHLILPIQLYSPKGGKKAYGPGDVEIGAKYRFIHETDMMPEVAFYPKATLPSGDARLGLGWGAATESPALWVEKNWGDWKLSGGGGYTFIQAAKTANYAFGGALLQRQIIESLSLAGELSAQGTINNDYRSVLIFTFGGSYNFTKNLSLPFSLGHSLAGQKTLTAYLGLDWVWDPCS